MLRTRQIAVAMVQPGFVREARVTFVWGPRDQRPSGVVLEADGRVLAGAQELGKLCTGEGMGRAGPLRSPSLLRGYDRGLG